MMESPRWLSILMAQLWSVPYIATYVVGIVLALSFWRRHPSVSLFALLGFLILLGNLFVGFGLNVWLMAAQDGSSSVDRARVLGVVGIIRSIVAVGAYGFLITAIFGWRRTDPKRL